MSNYPPQGGYPPPGYPPPVPPQPGYPPPGYPQPGYGPPRETPYAPKAGMGCLAKFLILLGILLLLSICCCCGGIFGGQYWLRKSSTDDPAMIQTITQDMTAIDVPPPLEPVLAGTYHVPLGSKVLGQLALYADKGHGSAMFLMAAGDFFGEEGKDFIRQGLENAAGQQNNAQQNREKLRNRKEEQPRQKTIRGEDAIFHIVTGVGADSGKQRIEVRGTFQGKTGPVFLMLDAEADRLPMEKINAMLDSIK